VKSLGVFPRVSYRLVEELHHESIGYMSTSSLSGSGAAAAPEASAGTTLDSSMGSASASAKARTANIIGKTTHCADRLNPGLHILYVFPGVDRGESSDVLIIGVLNGDVELLADPVDHGIGNLIRSVWKADELHRQIRRILCAVYIRGNLNAQ
jgi:hypothetical protein